MHEQIDSTTLNLKQLLSVAQYNQKATAICWRILCFPRLLIKLCQEHVPCCLALSSWLWQWEDKSEFLRLVFFNIPASMCIGEKFILNSINCLNWLQANKPMVLLICCLDLLGELRVLLFRGPGVTHRARQAVAWTCHMLWKSGVWRGLETPSDHTKVITLHIAIQGK